VERVSGIGGVFIRSRDPASLARWYAQHLGIEVDGDFQGTTFHWTVPGSTVWAVFPAGTDYFGRPEQQTMVNFRVANLDAMLAQLRAAGVKVEDRIGSHEFGRFGWAEDLEGNRFELWEPPAGH
jgi:predicted enzyme related to lactoylglutathione lyase